VKTSLETFKVTVEFGENVKILLILPTLTSMHACMIFEKLEADAIKI